jgi:hypothetical protein
MQTPYACHDRLLARKEALFNHLFERRRDPFHVSFDVLLYDLTSTYVIALVLTSEHLKSGWTTGIQVVSRRV